VVLTVDKMEALCIAIIVTALIVGRRRPGGFM
jgi:hypothetical protein